MLADKPRLGRPSKQIDETKTILETKIRVDRYGREKTCEQLAVELSGEARLQKTKPIRKPGLLAEVKEQCLKWCLKFAF
ncbi:hypothetical protein N7493_001224 [Penicillium malachiteum]|uniref:Uncharacterized protein n=1 Tax=Penicillium malachiteum TaxID=1324776 RepID=A0AAD6HUA9_9EURO|nr:hypothetical protein N7493_001224 [Penicillium malachiteum]